MPTAMSSSFVLPEQVKVKVNAVKARAAADRRSEPRFAANGPALVSLSSVPDARDFNAQVRDVSKSGMRIELDFPIPPGTMIEIDFARLTAIGIVRHCRKYEGTYSIGVRLEGVITKQ